MSANKQLLLGNVASGTYEPNAVKFDGANDYLTRGADLTGIADSKSGIFSAWLRIDNDTASTDKILANVTATQRFIVYRTAAYGLIIIGYNAVGASILSIRTNTPQLASSDWVHYLVSWDLATGATNIYRNDVSDKVQTTATNDTIDYATSGANWAVGSNTEGGQKFSSAISELYFAPGQYLDFSTESNRRKFIDADGLPVSLGADGSTPTGTAPAIYLKGDYSSFGTNSGTGGNFTVNGTLEKASTTPATLPAFNAVDFDGTSDYLSKTTDIAASDYSSGIFSAWVRCDGAGGHYIKGQNSANTVDSMAIGSNAGAELLRVILRDSSGTVLKHFYSSPYVQSPQWRHVIASWNTTTVQLYVDDVSDLVSTVTNSSGNVCYVSRYTGIAATPIGSAKHNGAISELYFAPNQYLDLSVQANREKFILNGAPVDLGADGSLPTGTAPAIYLPNRAALVGTNAGSGGNFTINGAPKDANSTPVYYYAEPVKFDGTNDYLTRGADLTGIADGKAGTVSFWMRLDGGNATGMMILTNLNNRFLVWREAANKIRIYGETAGVPYLSMYSSNTYVASAVWVHVLASWDLAATTGYLYINNVSDLAGSPTLTNNNIDYATTTPNWAVGGNTPGGSLLNGAIADLWFNTTYLDISQSSNRAKFIDQTTLRPVPLGAKGELPTGSQPLLYLGRDYANFQTNLGSGGNFTVTGALERGTTSPSDVRA